MEIDSYFVDFEGVWEPEDPAATGRFMQVNDQRLAVWERCGMGASILFAHATGFHARCWDQIIHRVPGAHCYAIDMRGHGLSSKPGPPYSWRWFGEDLAAVLREIKLKDAVGVGHSMGGHAVALAATLVPEAFKELLLIDPVIMPPGYYSPRERDPHFARKRKNQWQSAEEMIERFQDRLPFRDWDPAVLRDYCRWGLLAQGDQFVLACPPEVEASIYENSGKPEANLYGIIERIEVPVTVVRSERAEWGTRVRWIWRHRPRRRTWHRTSGTAAMCRSSTRISSRWKRPK